MSKLIKQKVIQFIEQNKLGCCNPLPVDDILNKLNIVAVFRPLGEGFSGMAIKAGEYKFMLINTSLTKGRQNFTIGHELYHLFVQNNFTPHQCSAGDFPKKNKEERNADLFATYLLMPETSILKRIPEKELMPRKTLSLNTVIELEQHFEVSHSAMLNRLYYLGLISEKVKEQYGDRIIENAKSLGFSTDIYKPTNTSRISGDHKERIQKLYDIEKISESHYYELMNIFGDG